MKFDIGTAILSEYDPDRFIGVQIDAYGEENSGMEPYELHSPYGFLSRPVDPESDGMGCQVLYAVEGNKGHAWLSHDPRYIKLLPQIKQGGSVQYCKKGGFASFDGDDSTYTIYVPYSFSGDTPSKAMAISVDVSTPGQENISIVHGSGVAVTITEKGIVAKNKAGDAYLEINDAGITLNGNITINGGLVGGSPVAAFPLVTFTGFSVFVSTLQASLASAGAPLTGPTAAAAVTAALGAALATLPTQKVFGA